MKSRIVRLNVVLRTGAVETGAVEYLEIGGGGEGGGRWEVGFGMDHGSMRGGGRSLGENNSKGKKWWGGGGVQP